MRRTLALAAALPLAWCLACGFLGGTEPRFTETVALSEPWSGYDLPVEGSAHATFSDGETTTIRHPGASPDDLGPRYAEALTQAGFALDVDTSSAGIVNQTWVLDDGTAVTLTIQDQDGTAVVSLSELPF